MILQRKRTEGADFQNGDYRSNLKGARIVEVFPEVWAGDDTAHDTVKASGWPRNQGAMDAPLVITEL
jgi:hypothetical protein